MRHYKARSLMRQAGLKEDGPIPPVCSYNSELEKITREQQCQGRPHGPSKDNDALDSNPAW